MLVRLLGYVNCSKHISFIFYAFIVNCQTKVEEMGKGISKLQEQPQDNAALRKVMRYRKHNTNTSTETFLQRELKNQNEEKFTKSWREQSVRKQQSVNQDNKAKGNSGFART